ncbi:MAG: DUF255 domain-containing protein [Terriglobales bacterium]
MRSHGEKGRPGNRGNRGCDGPRSGEAAVLSARWVDVRKTHAKSTVPGNLPYLRQHAENSVDWYPWGEEAFRRAREEDKPIHVSVSDAACHWSTHRADFLLGKKVMIVRGAKLRAGPPTIIPS